MQVCSRNHPKIPENTFGRNQCKVCHKIARDRYEKTEACKQYRAVNQKEAIQKLYKHEYYLAHKDKFRAYHWMRKYDISPEQYKELLARQNEKCAICGVLGTTTAKGLVVDHKKGTKEARGLLCNVCNSHVVHVVEDYPDRVERAKAYLGGF